MFGSLPAALTFTVNHKSGRHHHVVFHDVIDVGNLGDGQPLCPVQLRQHRIFLQHLALGAACTVCDLHIFTSLLIEQSYQISYP